MANVKISSKGRALLRKGYSSASVVSAIVKDGAKLTSKEGLVVNVDGKKLTVKTASPHINGKVK
ncbi:MAG TPA: hypothetical protein VK369_09360 [Segetibacter sp.]|jgi:hypothetical protein|nr:hypothetical protein [Segetibacter sp.]